jgi:hypothetical protein
MVSTVRMVASFPVTTAFSSQDRWPPWRTNSNIYTMLFCLPIRQRTTSYFKLTLLLWNKVKTHFQSHLLWTVPLILCTYYVHNSPPYFYSISGFQHNYEVHLFHFSVAFSLIIKTFLKLQSEKICDLYKPIYRLVNKVINLESYLYILSLCLHGTLEDGR